MKKTQIPYFDDMLIIVNSINKKFNTNYKVADVYDDIIYEYRKRSPLNEPVINSSILDSTSKWKIQFDEYRNRDVYLKIYLKEEHYLFGYLNITSPHSSDILNTLCNVYDRYEEIYNFITLHTEFLRYLYNTNEDKEKQEQKLSKILTEFINKLIHRYRFTISLDIVKDREKFINEYPEFEGYHNDLLDIILGKLYFKIIEKKDGDNK